MLGHGSDSSGSQAGAGQGTSGSEQAGQRGSMLSGFPSNAAQTIFLTVTLRPGPGLPNAQRAPPRVLCPRSRVTPERYRDAWIGVSERDEGKQVHRQERSGPRKP